MNDPNNPNNQSPPGSYPGQAPYNPQPVPSTGAPKVYGIDVGGLVNYATQEADGLFFKTPEQGCVLRIVPPNPAINPLEPGLFFQVASFHELDGEFLNCPNEILHRPCPFCEARMAIYRVAKLGGGRRELTDIEKAYAAKYNTRSNHIANVVVRHEEEKGVRPWRFGYKLKLKFIDWIKGQFGDITNTATGHDIQIVRNVVRSGNNIFPNYDNSMPILAKSPLGTPEQVAHWWENQPKLSELVLPKIKSYEELFQLCFGRSLQEAEQHFGGKVGAYQMAQMVQEKEENQRNRMVTFTQPPANYQQTAQPPVQPPAQQPPVQPLAQQPSTQQTAYQQPPVQQPPAQRPVQPPVQQPVQQPPAQQPVQQPPVQQFVQQPPVQQPPVQQLVQQPPAQQPVQPPAQQPPAQQQQGFQQPVQQPERQAAAQNVFPDMVSAPPLNIPEGGGTAAGGALMGEPARVDPNALLDELATLTQKTKEEGKKDGGGNQGAVG